MPCARKTTKFGSHGIPVENRSNDLRQNASCAIHPHKFMMSLQRMIERHGRRKESLIPILQAIQKEYRYLPKKMLRELAEQTDIAASDIVGVASFYDFFRHDPVGEHLIHVCTGTACHVKGADRVLESFRTNLDIPAHGDTDAAKKFTIQKVACLGCCTLAPVVQIDGVTYGHLTPSQVPDVLDDFLSRNGKTGVKGIDRQKSTGTEIGTVRVGLGSCCQAQGSAFVRDEIVRVIDEFGLDINVQPVGCVGMCHQTPLVELVSLKNISTFYAKVKPEDVQDILLRNYKPKNFLSRIGRRCRRLLENIWSDEFSDPGIEQRLDLSAGSARSFLASQQHLAMIECGELNPMDFDNYCENGGFEPIKTLLHNNVDSETIISIVEESGLRGRGGAGFPTFRKWSAVKNAPGDMKYVICNGDEGDPGAFMDRMLLESFPLRIIDGMMIAARAVGAEQGYLYIRAEYPLAVQRIRLAIEQCYEKKILGKNILGSDFSFDVAVMEGAGAFVCGEETALLESMEGRRGMPRFRPPYPATSGLFGKPTLINNVETYSVIPYIFRHSPKEFAKHGTVKSRGTKVFALAGKVRRGGLIEIPMGVSLRHVVEEIGGGVAGGKRFKAVQIGGPSGGCVPAALCDTPIDFESLSHVGAIMGSGGLVVLDEDDCMVDIARYFLQFTQEQSCGKCTFCRIGTKRMLEILNRLCVGKGKADDLEKLETLAEQVQSGSLCGLGKTAPNPVLSTLKYFRDEYEAHLQGCCPTGKCPALISYTINEKCNGCTLCVSACAVGAITSVPYRKHVIDVERCTQCDACRDLCPSKAIIRATLPNSADETKPVVVTG